MNKQRRIEDVIIDHLEDVDRVVPCNCWMKLDCCFCMESRDSSLNTKNQ